MGRWTRNVSHLMLEGAQAFTEAAAALQVDVEAAPHDGALFKRLQAHAIGAVVMMTAYLEALGNEVWAYDSARLVEAGYHADTIAALGRAGRPVKDSRDLTVLDRFNDFLEAIRTTQLDRGASPYQEAALIVRARNYFMHHRPEWLSSDEAPKWAVALQSRVRSVEAHGEGFPDRLLGADLARFAVASCSAFADEFLGRSGLPPPPFGSVAVIATIPIEAVTDRPGEAR